MKHLCVQWTVSLVASGDQEVVGLLTKYDGTTGREVESYRFSGGSSTVFEELLTALDASIFTSLAIAEGLVPEGQQVLL